MRRTVPSLAVAILAFAAGCADTTSPATASRAAPSPSALLGNPPPPPSDTSGTYSTSAGSLTFGAVYFLNPTGKNGFIHFNTDQPSGISISPNASIDYHQGTVTGRGTITGPAMDAFGNPVGTLTIDLSQVTGGSFDGSCAKMCASVTGPATFTADDGKINRSVDGTFTIGALDVAPPIPVTSGY